MDFKDLSYVVAIAKHQNITKAADSLFVTQPTLTKFLQHLERDLGQKLFRKLGNRFILTYAGERYVEKAIELLNLKKELDQEMRDIVKNNAGSLKIAFPMMRGTYMLPCTLPVFNSRYPNVKLDILEAHSSLLEGMLLSGEADIAFFNLPIKSPDVDFEIISHEEVLLVMAADHPLACKGVCREGCKYPWMDLHLAQREPFIMQLPQQRTRQTVERIFRECSFVPDDIKLQTSNISAAVDLASKGYGLFFVTETHLKHIRLQQEIACFSVGSPCTTVDFVAATRKGSYIPYHGREYIQIVREFT
ncbi:MAG: LysR family transcriptional regulator [Hungatella sp.]|nr:LysR family transcriptional regulator [Hungatella sp.]